MMFLCVCLFANYVIVNYLIKVLRYLVESFLILLLPNMDSWNLTIIPVDYILHRRHEKLYAIEEMI